MTTKEELDAEYQEKLDELQRRCDHVVQTVFAGGYGALCYATCDNCGDQISFDVRLRTDPVLAVSMLDICWFRLSRGEDNCAPWHWFDHMFSNHEIEGYYRAMRDYGARNKLADAIQYRISGRPYSSYAKELDMGPLK
jgi:hypothetical protein